MIADIRITEKSFGPKSLYKNLAFAVDDGEKIGVVGRNGVGKSTLLGIMTGSDTDYSGEVIYRRGTTVVATAQEHHGAQEQTVLQYILAGLPEYAELSHIVETYPQTMGDDMKLIDTYTEALTRFDDKGFYQIEEKIARELETFQLPDVAHRSLSTLSGGQKRLIEIVKVMHSDAHLALIDEPTNHMDYVAKAQFIDWMRGAREAMLIITHDRDVLKYVDRIIEVKDGGSVSYRGNYDAYLSQNASRTTTGMNDYEMIEKRMANLKVKVIDYQRLKEKSRNPSTIQKFKRLENQSRAELAELEKVEKPSFWIDKDSVAALDYKAAGRYEKFKTRNIRLAMKEDASRSSHVLVSAKQLSLGYNTPLFNDVMIDLREGEALELRGRNGAGKTTLIRALLDASNGTKDIATLRGGTIEVDPSVRIGLYEQEISPQYFDLSLHDAIERVYLDRKLSVGETKIHQLMGDYLFSDGDGKVPVRQLSGGQKARLQIIAMLASDPQLLILDEPTNHLDLPSIEELETALEAYSGAILYVSHDGYFREALGGEVVQVGPV